MQDNDKNGQDNMISQKEWGEIFRDIYQGEVEFHVPMNTRTSLAIGGTADVIATPADPLSMRNLIIVLTKKNIPFLPLGGGTNVLVRDNGVAGVVLLTKAFDRIEVLHEDNTNVEIFVESGVQWQKLVNFCKGKGYSGLEGLTGIPGTVGGAIHGNAGSFGYETKDVLGSVAIMDANGRLERFKAEGLDFGYRKSGIAESDVVLSANMKLKKDEQKAVSQRTEKFIEERRQIQPLSERSAGCVFRNPEGESAGRLIDEAGCKGMRIGGIEVSSVHANFFINTGEGTASDYINLMNEVNAQIHKEFGIRLEPEIRIFGRE
jgi:UDP-N-acetylmuramate dehydrogenase